MVAVLLGITLMPINLSLFLWSAEIAKDVSYSQHLSRIRQSRVTWPVWNPTRSGLVSWWWISH